MREEINYPTDIYCKLENMTIGDSFPLIKLEITVSKERTDFIEPLCKTIRLLREKDVRVTVNDFKCKLFGLLIDCNITATGQLMITIGVSKKKSRIIMPIAVRLKEFIGSNICLTVTKLR